MVQLFVEIGSKDPRPGRRCGRAAPEGRIPLLSANNALPRGSRFSVGHPVLFALGVSCPYNPSCRRLVGPLGDWDTRHTCVFTLASWCDNVDNFNAALRIHGILHMCVLAPPTTIGGKRSYRTIPGVFALSRIPGQRWSVLPVRQTDIKAVVNHSRKFCRFLKPRVAANSSNERCMSEIS